MDLTGIISISGKPGLYKIVSQTRGGLIVESLQDAKRTAVHGSERVSSLEDISIYTYEEDLLLSEVFAKMLKASDSKEVLSHKSKTEELKEFLLSVLPNYDQERVYTSDIKKLIQWYNILIKKGLLKAEENTKEKKETKKKSVKEGEKKPKTTAKKTAPKKQGAKPTKKASNSKQSNTKASSKGK